MRRKTAALALFLLLAPAVARLGSFSIDAGARCALACARAGLGVDHGAACCPTGHDASLPTLSSCAHDVDAAPLPAALGPMMLAAALVLFLPSSSGRVLLVPALAVSFPPARPLDKVPLRFA